VRSLEQLSLHQSHPQQLLVLLLQQGTEAPGSCHQTCCAGCLRRSPSPGPPSGACCRPQQVTALLQWNINFRHLWRTRFESYKKRTQTRSQHEAQGQSTFCTEAHTASINGKQQQQPLGPCQYEDPEEEPLTESGYILAGLMYKKCVGSLSLPECYHNSAYTSSHHRHADRTAESGLFFMHHPVTLDRYSQLRLPCNRNCNPPTAAD
jgi:hypothetical protein